MRIIAKRTLIDYWTKHPDAEQALKAWFADAQASEWTSPNFITENYAGTSILSEKRVCFNIKGNNYRLIVEVHYKAKIVYIKFVGSHAEYDEIDARTVTLPRKN